MKNVKMIGNIGDLLLVLGSAVYVYALLSIQTTLLTAIIGAIYLAAVAFKLAHFVLTREERRAAKAAAKAEKAVKA